MSDKLTEEPAGQYNWLIYATLAAVALLTLLFSRNFLYTFQIKEDVFQFDTVLRLLGPALIASLFVERAVEVIVATWRKFGRQHIEHQIEVLTDSLASAGNKAKQIQEQLNNKTEELFRYRSETLRLAAGFTVFFSFLIALIGVRVLVPFFDIDELTLNCITGLEIEPEECDSGVALARSHYLWLIRYDVFIATFVIAGGSAGVHSIVSAITAFADRTGELGRQSGSNSQSQSGEKKP